MLCFSQCTMGLNDHQWSMILHLNSLISVFLVLSFFYVRLKHNKCLALRVRRYFHIPKIIQNNQPMKPPCLIGCIIKTKELRRHLTGVHKSHSTQIQAKTAAVLLEIVLRRGMSHCGLYRFLLWPCCVDLSLLLFFSFPSICPLRLYPLFPFSVSKEGKDFKAQPFLKMHVFSGFNIVSMVNSIWWKYIQRI